jgi:hypothetical protein
MQTMQETSAFSGVNAMHSPFGLVAVRNQPLYLLYLTSRIVLIWSWESKARREHWHAIRTSSYAKGELRHITLALALELVVLELVVGRVLVAGMAAIVAMVSFSSPLAKVVIITTPARLRTMSATLIGLHTATDCLRRHTRTNLNVGLFDNHA